MLSSSQPNNRFFRSAPQEVIKFKYKITYIIKPRSGDFYVKIKNWENLVSATIQGVPDGSIKEIKRQADGDLRYEIKSEHGFSQFRVVIYNKDYPQSEFQLSAHAVSISKRQIEKIENEL